MLTIWSNGRRSLCNGLTRRAFLSVGTLALGGISLAGLLRHQAPAAERKHTPKSVIMVYLPGGPSHIDLYDMKPDAPVEIRGEFKHAKTKVPGIDLCELMPQQAKIGLEEGKVAKRLWTSKPKTGTFRVRRHQNNPERPGLPRENIGSGQGVARDPGTAQPPAGNAGRTPAGRAWSTNPV
jgi:hypothetical protein